MDEISQEISNIGGPLQVQNCALQLKEDNEKEIDLGLKEMEEEMSIRTSLRKEGW